MRTWGEVIDKVTEHQKVDLRVIRELSRLDFLVRGELGDLPSRKYPRDNLLQN